MKKSMSISHGSPGGRPHNIEIEYRQGLANVEPLRSDLNEVLVDRSLEDTYEDLFGEAVAKYNEKQKRQDRRIENYLDKIKSSKQEKPVYEMVVQIGNKDTNSSEIEGNRIGSSMIYREFLARLEQEFPNFRVHQAAIHLDEATPHLHVAYVPFSTGNARGLETKNSLSGAAKQMGYSDIRDVNERLFGILEEVASEKGIERLDVGCHRAHLNVRDYKAMVEQIEAEEKYPYRNDPRLLQLVLEQQEQIEEALEVIEEQAVTIDSIVEGKPGISARAWIKETMERCRSVADALRPRINALGGRVSDFKVMVAHMPERWRENIINTVSEALKGSREALKPKDVDSTGKSPSLRDIGSRVTAASQGIAEGAKARGSRESR